MGVYKYIWKDDPKQKRYASEANLKKAFPDACDPEKHAWKSTFQFGEYECRSCKALRVVV